MFVLLENMPTEYKRKPGSTRGNWSEQSLKEAITRIEAGEIGVNEAARYYGIPSRTLRRRKMSGNHNKLPLGPQGVLGIGNEKRMVRHIQRLEQSGFAPNRDTVRSLAYKFGEELGLGHTFNQETQMAGYDWLNSFFKRNPELTIRQAEGLSVARANGMNREEVTRFFDLLNNVFEDNQLFSSPGNIFNMDETGCQLNNSCGKVVASKGSKDVHTLTSGEKGENVSVIACCNAEGVFLPPVLIFKGVRENENFGRGLPPGSKVFLNPKSSYITSDLFYRWLREHFVPRKPPGKTVLILDGHSSHTNCYEMLNFADSNDIIVVCLPSHTTQALQPLDRTFFKPFKQYFKQEAQKHLVQNERKEIKKIHAGELIGKAWNRAASVSIAVNGFRATGIFPLDSDAVPNHFFQISDGSRPQESSSTLPDLTSNTPTNLVRENLEVMSSHKLIDLPVSSKTTSLPELSVPDDSHEALLNLPSTSKETPTKTLMKLSPIPRLPKPKVHNCRKKQSAKILNLSANNGKRQLVLEDTYNQEENARNHPKKTKKERVRGNVATAANPSVSIDTDKPNDNCIECLENYWQTTSKVPWVQCVICKNWMHENCSMYGVMCNLCGREEKRKTVAELKNKKH